MKQRLPLSQIDTRELLDDLRIDYTERGKNVSSGWIGVQCPWCDDASNHLGVNLNANTCSCFKCGKTGNIITYLSQELNSFKKAISIIEKHIPRELKQKEQEEYESNVEKVYLPNEAQRGLLPEHKAYLRSRNFNADILEEVFNLHSVDDSGLWRNRIIVPIVKRYRLVTYTSIHIAKESYLRYRHLSDAESIIPIKQLLFMEELTDGYTIIVTEGLFDALRFVKGAVPLWGVKYTDNQVKHLSKYMNVKIVGDGDKDGWMFNRKLSATLAPFCNVKYFDLADGLDPDKLSKSEIKHIKNAAC